MEASIHIFIVNYQIQFDFDSIKKHEHSIANC